MISVATGPRFFPLQVRLPAQFLHASLQEMVVFYRIDTAIDDSVCVVKSSIAMGSGVTAVQ